MDWHVETSSFLGPRHTQRHLKLTESAIQVFAEKGLAKASISEIAKRANVPRTQFYFAWEDKFDCYTFCLTISLAEVAERLEESIAGADTWQDKLRAGVATITGLVENHPDMVRIILQEGEGSGRGHDRAIYREAEAGLMEAILALYREIDEIEVAEPRMAQMAVGAARIILRTYLDEPDKPPSALTDDLTIAVLTIGFGPLEARELSASAA